MHIFPGPTKYQRSIFMIVQYYGSIFVRCLLHYFLFYMKDVLQINNKGKLTEKEKMNYLRTIIEQAFVKLLKCLPHKTLTVNFTKTFFIIFSSYKNTLFIHNRLIVNNSENQIAINRIENIRYLRTEIIGKQKDGISKSLIKSLQTLSNRFKYPGKYWKSLKWKFYSCHLYNTILRHNRVGWTTKYNFKDSKIIRKHF